MTNLRHYIRVYDDVLDDTKIQAIYKEVVESQVAETIDIPGITKYDHIPISPYDEDTKAQWLSMSYHFVAMLSQYKMDIGIQHESRWNEQVMESFTFRRYHKIEGFQTTMFDSRSETTAPIFMSGFYFLNDAPGFKIEFDHSVSSYGPISARKGRLVLFPSSWMFPYKITPSGHEADVIKAVIKWQDPAE